MAGLSFAQVEAVLARYTRTHDDRRDTLISRLKQWQKIDIPHGSRGGGQGVKVEYSLDQLFQLVYFTDLLRNGMTPERAKVAIDKVWPDIRAALYDTLVCVGHGHRHRHYFAIMMDSLGRLRGDPNEGPLGIFITTAAFTTVDVQLAYGEPPFHVPDEAEDRSEDDSAALALWRKISREARHKVQSAQRGGLQLDFNTMVNLILLIMETDGIDLSIFKSELEYWKQEALGATTRFHHRTVDPTHCNRANLLPPYPAAPETFSGEQVAAAPRRLLGIGFTEGPCLFHRLPAQPGYEDEFTGDKETDAVLGEYFQLRADYGDSDEFAPTFRKYAAELEEEFRRYEEYLKSIEDRKKLAEDRARERSKVRRAKAKKKDRANV